MSPASKQSKHAKGTYRGEQEALRGRGGHDDGVGAGQAHHLGVRHPKRRRHDDVVAGAAQPDHGLRDGLLGAVGDHHLGCCAPVSGAAMTCAVERRKARLAGRVLESVLGLQLAADGGAQLRRAGVGGVAREAAAQRLHASLRSARHRRVSLRHMRRRSAGWRRRAAAAQRASTMTLGVSKSGSPAARPITCAQRRVRAAQRAQGRVASRKVRMKPQLPARSVPRAYRLAGFFHGARQVRQRHGFALVQRSHARVDAALHAARSGPRRRASRQRGSAVACACARARAGASAVRRGMRSGVAERTDAAAARAAARRRQRGARRAKQRAGCCMQRFHGVRSGCRSALCRAASSSGAVGAPAGHCRALHPRAARAMERCVPRCRAPALRRACASPTARFSPPRPSASRAARSCRRRAFRAWMRRWRA